MQGTKRILVSTFNVEVRFRDVSLGCLFRRRDCATAVSLCNGFCTSALTYDMHNAEYACKLSVFLISALKSQSAISLQALILMISWHALMYRLALRAHSPGTTQDNPQGPPTGSRCLRASDGPTSSDSGKGGARGWWTTGVGLLRGSPRFRGAECVSYCFVIQDSCLCAMRNGYVNDLICPDPVWRLSGQAGGPGLTPEHLNPQHKT